MSVTKFVKSIALPNGDVLTRSVDGTRWQLHYSGGRPQRRDLSEAQAVFIEAAILAGITYAKGQK